MPRRLFTILPLLLGAAVCVLWVRSYSVMDTLAHWSRDVDWFDPRGVFTRADVWSAHSWKGALAVGRYRSFDRAIVGGPDGWVYQAHRDPKGSLFLTPAAGDAPSVTLPEFNFQLIRHVVRRDTGFSVEWRLVLPYWLVAGTLLLPSLGLLIGWRRRAWRRPAGR